MKMFEFRLKFHWSLFLRVQSTIFKHWFRQWLGADKATSHYLNQWWLDYRRIYASHGLHELSNSSLSQLRSEMPRTHPAMSQQAPSWWRHQMETFYALLALCVGNSPVNCPHKGQWRGALMFSLICAWSKGWVKNRDCGDLRRHRAHYDVTVRSHCWLVWRLILMA